MKIRLKIAALEVMPNQLHLLVTPHRKNSPSYVADRFKGFTSHHLRAEFGHLRSRLPMLWSCSYFVATAGAMSTDTVRRYVETRYERPAKGGGGA